MRSKNEDAERKRKESQGNRGGEGVYIREARSIHSKRVRRDTEREREQTYPEEKNETNSDGLEVNSRQEETDWRYLKLSFFAAGRLKG